MRYSIIFPINAMRPQRFSLLALLFVLSVFVSKPVFAQIDQDTLPFKHLEVGPFFTAGLSIFQGDVPDGAKTDVHFAFSGGALAMYSFHPHWGFGLALGYESRGMYFHEQANDTINETIGLNYLSIRPSIKFKQFLLGVNIGIPLSATTEYSHSNLSLVYPPITKDIMNTILDIRAEGLLPCPMLRPSPCGGSRSRHLSPDPSIARRLSAGTSGQAVGVCYCHACLLDARANSAASRIT